MSTDIYSKRGIILNSADSANFFNNKFKITEEDMLPVS